MIVVKVRYHGQHFLASCRATLCVQVAKLCCPHYHPRKQHQNLLPKVEPSSTSCNMLLQLATLKFDARQVACRVVIRATKLCNLQSNNVVRQVARKCCPYYRTLMSSSSKSSQFFKLSFVYTNTQNQVFFFNSYGFKSVVEKLRSRDGCV